MATPLFVEPGSDATFDLSFYPYVFTSGSGTVASASDQVHTGVRSIKCVAAAGGDKCSFGTHDATFSVDSGLASFWVRFDAVPSALTSILTIYGGPGVNGSVFMVGVRSDGKLKLSGQGGGGPFSLDGSTVLSANTWYRVSLSWNVTSTTNFTAKVYLNSVLEITLTNATGTLSLTDTDMALFGIDDDVYGTPAVMTQWFDSIYCDDRTDQSDCGDIRVTAKRPRANGTVNGFTTQIGSGGSGQGTGHSPQVNERPLSQTNGWSMIGAGSAVTEEYNVESVLVGDVNITGLTIKGVMGWVFASSLVGETGKIVVDGTQTNIALTGTPTLFLQLSPNPLTFPAGTGTDVGIVTDTSLTTVSLYEAGIVVAYQPAAGGIQALMGQIWV